MSSEERLDDRFELEARIGSGGMGEVFRARDPVTGEVVAVKILPGSQGPLAERFTREIEVLAGLDHPGIVRYISHGVTPAGAGKTRLTRPFQFRAVHLDLMPDQA